MKLRSRTVRVLVCAVAAGLLAGCGGGKPRVARDVRPAVIRDVPAVLRNTIGSEVTVRRTDPVLVSGYGLVVGLNGTGGGILDEQIAVTMERELGLKGVNKASDEYHNTPLERLTPREVLRHPDVAVAIVYATVPPGAPEGAEFDVYVRAVNNGGTASLEGGTLWSTDLRLGPPATFGRHTTRLVGVARGPIFINPFAEPPVEGADDTVVRSIGRVLGGGSVTESSHIALQLDNASHTRARAIQAAVRNRFPEGPGDRGPVARGRSDSVVEVSVPSHYRDRAGEFLRLLLHTPIDQTFPAERARQYTAALESQPALASSLTWCLEALGKPAIPFVRELYDAPEAAPRLAALRAGVGLNDPRAAASLKDLAQSGPPGLRTEAITLLGRLDAGPTVDLALRDMLAEPELDVRVAAYEALAERAEIMELNRRRLGAQGGMTPAAFEATDIGRLDRIALAGDTIQGVRRTPIEGKFLLDAVPAGDALIYITQQGTPKVTLFGGAIDLPRPMLASVWSGRLMLTADSPTDDVRVYYRDAPTGRSVTGKPGNTVWELVRFMARTPTPERPEPGLGMSYSEVVGALYALQRAGALPAPFATEEDRLQATLLKAATTPDFEERPEAEGDAPVIRVYEPVTPPAPRPTAPGEKPSLVEPLPARNPAASRP
ncbi:MAG: flagellar basal body P-ring protein FlgI [Phycisphaerales bacterium]